MRINLPIQTKVVILILAIVAIFFAAIYLLRLSEDEKIRYLIKEREKENITSFNKTLTSIGKSLELFAFDYSYWDEMLNFTITGDTVWAKDNIEASLETFDVNAAFVYRRDLSLMYSVNNFEEKIEINIGPVKEIIRQSADNKYLKHYYVKDGPRVYEIRTAPIQPSSDLKRETEPVGFFIVLKLLSENYLSDLSIQTSSLVKFEEVAASDNHIQEHNSYTTTTSFILKSWDNKPIGSLVSFSDFVMLKKSNELFNIQLLAFIGFTILVLIIVSFFLMKNVSLPLNTISKSLRDENPNLLRKYSNRKDEFGRLSNLISEFFVQKENLLQEIIRRKQTESSLQESEEKYRKIFENIQDIFYQTDKNGIITSISPSIERYSEYKPEEVIGRDIKDFYLEPSERSNLMQEISLTGEVADYEIILVTKKGKLVHCSVNSHFIKNAKGEITGVEGSARDITERKQHEEKIVKLSQAIEQSPVSVLITDTVGRIEYVNPKFTALSGYTAEEVISKNAGFIKSDNTKIETYKGLWETINSGNEWSGEIQNRKKNGDLYWENILISPIKNNVGKITNFIGIKEDITEKKKIIEELISAKDKAEEMNRLKSSFLANMSHELRTPLIGILGFSEILSSEIKETEWNMMLERINQGGKRLLETLNLILDLSKHEAQKIELKYERINVNELFNECISLLMPMANKKRLYLNYNFNKKSIITMIDRKMLQSIVNNIVGNAIKYTHQGGIQVDVDLLTNHQDTSIIFKTTDTGIGIAKNNLSLIFDEFRQVSEGLNRQYEGTGLGLAITKKFVEKLGGSIAVSSEAGTGTTFVVVLPFVKPEDSEVKENIPLIREGETKNEQKTRRILFVDDDSISRDLVKIFLSDNYIVDTAYNKSSAKLLMESNQYSLILLDINLGSGENGIDLLHEIRVDQQKAKLPIVAITAYAMDYDKTRFLKEGFDDYLTKPFLKAEFLTMVEKYLKS